MDSERDLSDLENHHRKEIERVTKEFNTGWMRLASLLKDEEIPSPFATNLLLNRALNNACAQLGARSGRRDIGSIKRELLDQAATGQFIKAVEKE
jgi:hypothetical protein